jgi:hypothetical protein
MTHPLICRSVRLLAGWKMDGGVKPGRWLARHLGNCPGCRHWVADQTHLTRQFSRLTDTFGAPNAFDFQEFERRRTMAAATVVCSSKRRANAEEAEHTNPWAGWATALGAACAVAFVTFCFWQATQTPNDPSSAAFANWQGAIKEALELAQQPTPLQREFEAVLTDAERAAKALGEGIASRELVAEWSERVYGPGE